MNAKTETVLILGATSDIGRAIAREYAEHGCALQLAGRDSAQLAREAEDLKLRHGVPVSAHVFDVLEMQTHSYFVAALDPLPDTAVCVVGLLGDQKEDECDFGRAELVMRTNYLGPASVLGELANRFAARGAGTLIGISSVAGDRGRATNYVYGSAKAGFTAFLSGLRNRLVRSGVHVITVKPGFVRTRMTKGMALPGLLTAEPNEIGRAIYAAARRRANVVYVRPIWRYLMWAVEAIPEGVFKRLRI